MKTQTTKQGADGIGFRSEMNSTPQRNKKANVAAMLLCLAFAGAMLVRTQTAIAQDAPLHIVPVVPQGQQPLTPSGAHLNYYGGPIVSNIDLVIVYWGSNVSTVVTGGIPEFYDTILSSSYMTILSQYDTGGQKIGPGSYRGPYTIVPSKCKVGPCHLSDADIQTEIQAQVANGGLPPPNPPNPPQNVDQNTMYMVYFPPQVTITDPEGSQSCASDGFCGYHNSAHANFGTLLYGVMPDFGKGSGCDTGCGGDTEFGNITAVSSHEFSETITDPDVGFAQGVGYPMAWYDPANGEIGDICNQQHTAVCSYVVQKEWSNEANACVPLQPIVCDSPNVVNVPGAASKTTWNQFSVVDDDRLFQYQGSFVQIPGGGWAFPPAAPQPDGSFFMVVHFGALNHLVQYNPSTTSFTDYGSPPGALIVTTPSEVMYGNRVYLIARDTTGYQYNNLWEMKYGGGKGAWLNFGSSPFALSLLPSTPSVLYDGSLFFIDIKGELINMWWDASAPPGHQWVFLNNGYCVPGKGIWPFDTPPVGALYVGAPMDSSKVFVTCTDETLRQRWYDASNGGSWHWINHGKPTWYLNHNPVTAYADTRPIALGSGHVFLNASTTSSGSDTDQTLVQLWYRGPSDWVWVPQGDPPTTFLTGNVDGDPLYPPNVYSLGKDGHIWDAQYDPNTFKFVWIDLGIPDGDQR